MTSHLLLKFFSMFFSCITFARCEVGSTISASPSKNIKYRYRVSMQEKTCFLDYVYSTKIWETPCTPISAAGRRGVFRLNYRVCRVRQVKAVTHLLFYSKRFL